MYSQIVSSSTKIFLEIIFHQRKSLNKGSKRTHSVETRNNLFWQSSQSLLSNWHWFQVWYIGIYIYIGYCCQKYHLMYLNFYEKSIIRYVFDNHAKISLVIVNNLFKISTADLWRYFQFSKCLCWKTKFMDL